MRPADAARWHFLDTLRGFALLGILLVNGLDITRLGTQGLTDGGEPVADPVRDALYLAVQTRFVPIFAFLFGMSLWFVLAGARRRNAKRPWLVVVRRLLALELIGQLLAFVYEGNILPEYGIWGVLVLPLVLFLPRRAVLVLGLAATAAAYELFGSGEATTPGLMSSGAGAAALGLSARLERAGPGVVVACCASAACAVPAIAWQLTEPGDPRFTMGGVAGVILAVTYSTGLALLWRTPLKGALAAFFEPLGRMALSNSVGAAVTLAVAAALVDFGRMATVTWEVMLSLALIVVQSLICRTWLKHFDYGPLEWLWRAATWWSWPTLRRADAAARPAAGAAGT